MDDLVLRGIYQVLEEIRDELREMNKHHPTTMCIVRKDGSYDTLTVYPNVDERSGR